MKIRNSHTRNAIGQTRYCNNCRKIAMGEHHPLGGCSCDRPDVSERVIVTLEGTPEEMAKVYETVNSFRHREPI